MEIKFWKSLEFLLTYQEAISPRTPYPNNYHLPEASESSFRCGDWDFEARSHHYASYRSDHYYPTSPETSCETPYQALPPAPSDAALPYLQNDHKGKSADTGLDLDLSLGDSYGKKSGKKKVNPSIHSSSLFDTHEQLLSPEHFSAHDTQNFRHTYPTHPIENGSGYYDPVLRNPADQSQGNQDLSTWSFLDKHFNQLRGENPLPDLTYNDPQWQNPNDGFEHSYSPHENIQGSSAGEIYQPNNQEHLPFVPSPPKPIFPNIDGLRCYWFYYNLFAYSPSTVDGKLVIDLVNSLKFKEGTKFLDLPIYHWDYSRIDIRSVHQAIFCLKSKAPHVSGEFFDFFVAVRRKLTSVAQENQDNNEELQQVFRYLIARESQNTYHFSSFAIYKKYVLKDFEGSISRIKNRINQKFFDEDEGRKSRKEFAFSRFSQLFPIFLLYVDMISVLVPAGNLDNEGKLLRSQRLVAGRYFFQLLEYSLLEYKQDDLPRLRYLEHASSTQLQALEIIKKN